MINVEISPRMMTVITTYQCTAACQECCFECSPKLTSRLSLSDITNSVEQAMTLYPDLEIVIFTGGECFTLKDDLFDAIAFCSRRGLKTRCVTNGYWAKRMSVAQAYAERLLAAGIGEINISTGKDHQQWVEEQTVINAAIALTEQKIVTLVTLEKDTEDSNCFKSIRGNPSIIELLANKSELFMLRSNVWMPFFQDSELRGKGTIDLSSSGCDQVFDNLVITPKKEVSACCGLTLEHIPEMKLGTIEDLSCYKTEQINDFLKLWIKTEGPMKIAQRLIGDQHPKLANVVHQCQACALIHQDKEIVDKLLNEYDQHLLRVAYQYKVQNLGLSRGTI